MKQHKSGIKKYSDFINVKQRHEKIMKTLNEKIINNKTLNKKFKSSRILNNSFIVNYENM